MRCRGTKNHGNTIRDRPRLNLRQFAEKVIASRRDRYKVAVERNLRALLFRKEPLRADLQPVANPSNHVLAALGFQKLMLDQIRLKGDKQVLREHRRQVLETDHTPRNAPLLDHRLPCVTFFAVAAEEQLQGPAPQRRGDSVGQPDVIRESLRNLRIRDGQRGRTDTQRVVCKS